MLMRCTNCGAPVKARNVFEAEGCCPECGEEDCLVEEDAYDEAVHELRCAECGWEVEAGVRVEWDGQPRVFTVDDDCPVCAALGIADPVLEPADAKRFAKELPEYGLARAAGGRLRRETVGDGIPVDVDRIAELLGLTVRRGTFRHDGKLVGRTIEVPEGHRGAERFVIAHEIGHHELQHQGDRHKIEPEANAFASELIIPRHALQAAVREGATLRGLASRFDVSMQATVYALQSARLLSRIAG
jgi:predicted RNA-binding Zn-ribbon protein involved in translation (DUF1610 family)